MKSLVDHLANYASYHRDRRNIATHFVGIPMIVVAIEGLLARPALAGVTPGMVVTALAVLFYLALDLRFGVAMAGVLAAACWGGTQIAAASTASWLTVSIGLFVVGWIIQFIGHFFEGRKPAFVDDLVGLLVGPLFVVAEVAFAVGVRDEVREEIERRAGPTRAGRPVSSST
jgi:uncharacterized membrane protein YGL010W